MRKLSTLVLTSVTAIIVVMLLLGIATRHTVKGITPTPTPAPHPTPIAKKIILFENVDFGGRSWEVTQTTGSFSGWQNRSASSIRVQGFGDNDWNAFFETANNSGDDQLYLQGNGELNNLHTIARPHGNNHWGDRISQVQVAVAPSGSNENQTILSHGTRNYVDGNHGNKQLDNTNPRWGQP